MLNARIVIAVVVAAACLATAPKASAQSPEYVVFKLLDDSCAAPDGDVLSSSEADVEPVNDELVT